MFVYQRKIRVQDTDATGVLYFANQLQIGLEAFEEFMHTQGVKVGELIKLKKFLLPIVHAEADFFAPVYLSDELELQLTFPKIGTTSLTHHSEVRKEGTKVGTVSIVHVVYCPTQKKSIPIPDLLKKLL